MVSEAVEGFESTVGSVEFSSSSSSSSFLLFGFSSGSCSSTSTASPSSSDRDTDGMVLMEDDFGFTRSFLGGLGGGLAAGFMTPLVGRTLL